MEREGTLCDDAYLFVGIIIAGTLWSRDESFCGKRSRVTFDIHEDIVTRYKEVQELTCVGYQKIHQFVGYGLYREDQDQGDINNCVRFGK